jgi:HEAT repeat protein
VFTGNLAQTAPQELLAMAVEDSDILAVTPQSMPAPPTSFDALADLGPPLDDETQAEVRQLVLKLKDQDVSSRWKAAMALLQFGPAAKDAVPALLEAIDDEAPSVAEAAAQSYRKITGKEPPAPKPKAPPAPKVSPALTGLIEQLRSRDSFVRWRAVLGLGELGEQAAPATGELEDLLDDPDDNVRWSAATSLGKIGPGAREAVPALAAALSDREDTVIHRHAAAALARLGPAARDAVPGLIGALKDKDSDVREEVIEALVRIGAAAVPPLIEALQDDDERVRFEAADALTKIGMALQAKRAS